MKENYMRSVRALLDCPARERARLLSRLDSAVTAFLADVPEAGEADLTANFGTPGDCAARLLEGCPAALTARWRKIRFRRVWAALLAILLLVAVALAVYLRSHHWILRIPLDS